MPRSRWLGFKRGVVRWHGVFVDEHFALDEFTENCLNLGGFYQTELFNDIFRLLALRSWCGGNSSLSDVLLEFRHGFSIA